MSDANRAQWRPELLAGYSDGELGPADTACVEAWLTEHPEAYADLEAQRRISPQNRQLCKDPPVPAEAAWAAVLDRVHAAVTVAAATPAPIPVARRPWRSQFGPLAAIAAAVLLALSLGLLDRPQASVGPSVDPAEVLTVATDDDVDILSLQETDTQMLVVGKPPLGGALELVDDIVVESVAADAGCGTPKVQAVAGQKGPVLVIPRERDAVLPVP